MQPRIMITNGGAHPPQKHADATAWKIVDLIRVPETPIDLSLSPEDRAAIEAGREAARQVKGALEPKIAAVLLKHHTAVQEGERGMLKERGADHVNVAAVLKEINPLFAGTMVATHFAKPEAQERLLEILDHDFGHTMQIERSWRRDRSAAA